MNEPTDRPTDRADRPTTGQLPPPPLPAAAATAGRCWRYRLPWLFPVACLSSCKRTGTGTPGGASAPPDPPDRPTGRPSRPTDRPTDRPIDRPTGRSVGVRGGGSPPGGTGTGMFTPDAIDKNSFVYFKKIWVRICKFLNFLRWVKPRAKFGTSFLRNSFCTAGPIFWHKFLTVLGQA